MARRGRPAGLVPSDPSRRPRWKELQNSSDAVAAFVRKADLCCICILPERDVDALAVAWCGHVFHRACIDAVLAAAGTRCPLCRRHLLNESDGGQGERGDASSLSRGGGFEFGHAFVDITYPPAYCAIMYSDVVIIIAFLFGLFGSLAAFFAILWSLNRELAQLVL